MQVRTQYAQLDDSSVAFQVFGHGDVDLVIVPAMVSHIELMWGDPAVARFMRRLASFARVIVYDKLGTGLSDPILGAPSIEERARELAAVIEAAGASRPHIFGLFDGGATAAFHAASNPEAIDRLVLYGTHPVGPDVDDAPEWEEGQWVARFRRMRGLSEGWGDGRTLSFFSGTVVNQLERQFWSTFERASASPGMVRAMVRELGERDIRDLLGHVGAPTLVLHHEHDSIHPIEQGQLIAAHVPDARLVPVGGPSRWPWAGDPDAVLSSIREHLTGEAAPPDAARTMATIVFTDIVGSTERAAQVGDRTWRNTLEAVDDLTRKIVAEHDGRYVKSTGDGALMVFNGPGAAIRAAGAILEQAPGIGLDLRAGLHTGEVEHMHEGDIGGLAVHIAARVSALAGAGEVLVSGASRNLVAGAEIRFIDRGLHDLKGVPGQHRVLQALTGAAPARGTSTIAQDRGLRPRDRAAVTLTRRAPSITRFFSRFIPHADELAPPN